jgi:hypothetical protein
MLVMLFLSLLTLSVIRLFPPVKKVSRANLNKTAAYDIAQQVIENLKTWDYEEITLENIHRHWGNPEEDPPEEGPVRKKVFLTEEAKTIPSEEGEEITIMVRKEARREIYLQIHPTKQRKLIKVRVEWYEVRPGSSAEKSRQIELLQVF